MLDIDVLKTHLRVDSGDEDAYIESLASAAIGYAQKHTGRVFYETTTELESAKDKTGVVIDDMLKEGVLLLVGHWYNAREAVNIGNIVANIPMSAGAIFDLYRRPTL
jgi:hypothetical protein